MACVLIIPVSSITVVGDGMKPDSNTKEHDTKLKGSVAVEGMLRCLSRLRDAEQPKPEKTGDDAKPEV